jgi:tRNA-splicing ligase RtcB
MQYKYKNHELMQVGKATWEISKSGAMRVPARVYATESMLTKIIADNSLSQLINIATLPGIKKYAMAMPDIHYGYGFPIGGVAAFDCDNGIISPGGVGYDINCGVRFCRTNLFLDDIKDKIEAIVQGFYQFVPSGVGSHGGIRALNHKEENEVMIKGAQWAVEQGYGTLEDIDSTESFGRMEGTNPDKVSQRAMSRGANQVGTLGSGNHFLEIGIVDKIYDQKLADEFQLEKNQVIVIVHSGSRGFGYQICDDYLHQMVRQINELPFSIPDRQLACAPFQSKLGQDYFSAMCCAANYAWANRQVLMRLAEKALIKKLSISPSALGLSLIYDVCHNIAKIEKHTVDGTEMTLCLHRKGATRAFAPNHPELPAKFQSIGQPVIVPGDMGTYSFLMVGTAFAMKETFGSCCHGAGRELSRKEALRRFNFNDVKNKLLQKGIVVYSVQKNTLVEESPNTYKDVTEVVNAVSLAGIAKKVVRTRPLGVLKG